VLLIIIVVLQGVVYACGPAAALWNLRAQRVPAEEYRRRFAQRQERKERRGAPSFATVGFAGALFLAVVAGIVLALFAAPSKLAPVPAKTIGAVAAEAAKHGTPARVVQQAAAATVDRTAKQ
jgi:hypothetical protein